MITVCERCYPGEHEVYTIVPILPCANCGKHAAADLKVNCVRTRNDIHAMCIEHFNQPILVMFRLARLIGYAEDHDDCYLIVKYPRAKDAIVWTTAVGGYTFLDKLKGQGVAGEWDDFSRLDSMLTHNDVPKAEAFTYEISKAEAAERTRQLWASG